MIKLKFSVDIEPKCKKNLEMVEMGGVQMDHFKGKPVTQFTFAGWFKILEFGSPKMYQLFTAKDSSNRGMYAVISIGTTSY